MSQSGLPWLIVLSLSSLQAERIFAQHPFISNHGYVGQHFEYKPSGSPSASTPCKLLWPWSSFLVKADFSSVKSPAMPCHHALWSCTSKCGFPSSLCCKQLKYSAWQQEKNRSSLGSFSNSTCAACTCWTLLQTLTLKRPQSIPSNFNGTPNAKPGTLHLLLSSTPKPRPPAPPKHQLSNSGTSGTSIGTYSNHRCAIGNRPTFGSFIVTNRFSSEDLRWSEPESTWGPQRAGASHVSLPRPLEMQHALFL